MCMCICVFIWLCMPYSQNLFRFFLLFSSFLKNNSCSYCISIKCLILSCDTDRRDEKRNRKYQQKYLARKQSSLSDT